MVEYIDLKDTEVLAEAGENAKLVVEEDGELKRIPASTVGQVKTVNGREPDEAGNVVVSGLPEGAAAHQQLVTDETGAAKWEARTHYVAPDGTVHPLDAKFIPETIARTADVNAAVSALGTVLRFKGAVATVDLLPTEGNELGDVYYVTEGSSGYAWIQDADGTQRWEQLGPMISGEFLPAGATAHQQLVTDGEGKAKWEDKAFYEAIQYGEERYGTDNLNYVEKNGVCVAGEAFSISFDTSKQYVVEQYPGYICDVKTKMGMNYIGNSSMVGVGEDTGEPFFVMENSGMADVAFKGAPASQLFYLRDVVVTIKSIDEKFFPGAYVRKITLPEDVAPSVLESAVDALKNGDAIVMWDFKRIVEGEVSTQDRYAYLRFADTSIAGADEIAGYYSWDWHSDDATLNLFEGVIKYQNSFRLRSSSGNKVYEITVDDSGTLTTTEV